MCCAVTSTSCLCLFPQQFSVCFVYLSLSFLYFIWARATECWVELFSFSFPEITLIHFLGAKGEKKLIKLCTRGKMYHFYDNGWGKISLKDGPRRWLHLDVWHLYMCIAPWPTKKVSCRLTGSGPFGFVLLLSYESAPACFCQFCCLSLTLSSFSCVYRST